MRKEKMERNEKRCGWNKQEKEVRVDKEERKEKNGKKEKGKREESDREREKQKGRFSRHSDGLRVKVDPRIAGYVWVPKSCWVTGIISNSVGT